MKSLISNYISENNKRNSHHRGEFDLFNLMIVLTDLVCHVNKYYYYLDNSNVYIGK